MFKDGRRRIGFLEIAVVCPVVDRAVLLPDRCACFLIQRRDVLVIRAVERQVQQVAEHDRRRSGGSQMIAWQVLPRPQDLAVGRVETRRSRAAVMHPQAAFFDHRRRARRTRGRESFGKDQLIAALLGDLEHGHVAQDLARTSIDANHRQPLAIRRRIRHPDPVAPHHRRRPCLAIDRRLPSDVLRLAPLDRQTRRCGSTITTRSAKLVPILGSGSAGTCRSN